MLREDIFKITSELEFNTLALRVFKFQYEANAVYQKFCKLLDKHPSNVNSLRDIPFIPIEFFKSHDILSSKEPIVKTFTSSGTTGSQTSKHFITDLTIYEDSFNIAFQEFYGNPEDYAILALLPSYLERDGSSLIYMANNLIADSKHPKSGFYLHNLEDLAQTLKALDASGQKTLLIGVSFALLDLVDAYSFQLENTIVMETGGMKGRRKEMIREELHEILSKGFGVNHIHSEYGMTELLSQAYSNGQGVFNCPKHMKILIRDPEDALTYLNKGKTGGINVIDLANLNSCSFIATQDLGKQISETDFEILGRFDHSDVRGCNLMVL
ncbi:possible acyl protein synthase/acyl-CoA reductase-like protein [Croceibacter atlanticus HTCC2559]|jgi:phenylacetate-coenzyme A ligase PaaK-like adenylate-forming protein|uniref:Possible acyl protein synthase/acyl-CoA reductase-like protein n=2 Tax=Croceibacter TaxID=216431 RepID=A3U5D8_CROAH|nr:possible acyl protein synthase/acyl-CoA reductase-like protein [Croceibacter atlanticus HTCC2559]